MPLPLAKARGVLPDRGGRRCPPTDRNLPGEVHGRVMWVSVAARAARRDPIGRIPRMARVKTLEDFSGKPAYMGVDVGKTSHWAYAVDAAGRAGQPGESGS